MSRVFTIGLAVLALAMSAWGSSAAPSPAHNYVLMVEGDPLGRPGYAELWRFADLGNAKRTGNKVTVEQLIYVPNSADSGTGRILSMEFDCAAETFRPLGYRSVTNGAVTSEFVPVTQPGGAAGPESLFGWFLAQVCGHAANDPYLLKFPTLAAAWAFARQTSVSAPHEFAPIGAFSLDGRDTADFVDIPSIRRDGNQVSARILSISSTAKAEPGMPSTDMEITRNVFTCPQGGSRIISADALTARGTSMAFQTQPLLGELEVPAENRGDWTRRVLCSAAPVYATRLPTIVAARAFTLENDWRWNRAENVQP